MHPERRKTITQALYAAAALLFAVTGGMYWSVGLGVHAAVWGIAAVAWIVGFLRQRRS
ncbi:hypothetical protein [Deinococcus enclensis]|uniref:Uncharacterized protein n=1 Tax=Deinococcus enclensis TaxID=1049582 RepID=A0ABT9MFA9_9DEIO|nr:hypothetical protein [Deinococcus enclensis]MDP9765235.1 hypothetical protein [Deinococcus enclensis]